MITIFKRSFKSSNEININSDNLNSFLKKGFAKNKAWKRYLFNVKIECGELEHVLYQLAFNSPAEVIGFV
jgi:hypothetical protein